MSKKSYLKKTFIFYNSEIGLKREPEISEGHFRELPETVTKHWKCFARKKNKCEGHSKSSAPLFFHRSVFISALDKRNFLVFVVRSQMSVTQTEYISELS